MKRSFVIEFDDKWPVSDPVAASGAGFLIRSRKEPIIFDLFCTILQSSTR